MPRRQAPPPRDLHGGDSGSTQPIPDMADLPTQPALPPHDVPPRFPPDPRAGIRREPTKAWGSDPAQRRQDFLHLAEQHDNEARRLFSRLNELNEFLPAHAHALQIRRFRLGLLERIGPARTDEETRELRDLHTMVSFEQAEHDKSLAERRSLPAEIAEHRQAAAEKRGRQTRAQSSIGTLAPAAGDLARASRAFRARGTRLRGAATGARDA